MNITLNKNSESIKNPLEVLITVRLPKYENWGHYDDWLAMNAWKIMLEEFMGPFPGRTAPADNS